MAKVCKRHADNPVMIYHQCVGCELEWFREELEQKQQEIKRLEQERDKLIEGLRVYLADLAERHHEAMQKWDREADMYEQGAACAYDIAESMLRDILKEIGVDVSYCWYPSCYQPATHTWALVPVCSHHWESIRKETKLYYARRITADEREHYHKIKRFTPWR